MKKFLLLCLLFVATDVLATDYVLEGTIGKFPVVMSLSVDGNTCEGTYFYTASKHDIYFKGSAAGKNLKLTVNQDGDDTKAGETFLLTIGDKGIFNGTWTNNSRKPLSVELHPVNINAIKNPYAGLPGITPDVPYSYVRSSTLKIVTDSIVKSGSYTLTYIRIDQTEINMVQISGGTNPKIIQQVNDRLKNMLLASAEENFACEVDNYHISHPYVNSSVLSFDVFTSVYCPGAAHPDFGDAPVNINLKTGKDLKFDDVLLLPELPTPDKQAHYDAWVDYQSNTFAPRLLVLLRGLYPKEMHTALDDDTSCNYNDAEVWKFASWYLTDKGMYLSPDFPHVQGPCRNPEWSIIPFSEIKKHPNPQSGIRVGG